MLGKYKLFLTVGLVMLLVACGHDDNKNTNTIFAISNVNIDTELKTGNPATLSFSLNSNNQLKDTALSVFMTSIEDDTQQFNVQATKVSEDSNQALVTITFSVPDNVPSGDYKISINITNSSALPLALTINETLELARVKVMMPSRPELNVEKAVLTNNSFRLPKTKPNDSSMELKSEGDFTLQVALQSKYGPLSDDIELSFNLELTGLGLFPLDTTSHILVSEPDSTTQHRDVNKNGKVVKRIKGPSRLIKPICKNSNNTELCRVIGKNGSRQLSIDLHVNQDTYAALVENANDTFGFVVIDINTTADLTQSQYRLPIVYLHQSTVLQKSQRSTTNSTVSASSTNNVNIQETVSAGDKDYLHHTTTGQANTFQDSAGHANSTQSKDISVIINGQNYEMATMETSITTGTNDDINNTSLGITLNAMGGAVFDFVDTIVNNQAKSASYSISNQQPVAVAKSSSSVTTYNPQDEMVWIRCANQHEKCNIDTKNLPGSTQVRYGDPVSNRWNYRPVTYYNVCNDDHFGDPAKGVVKVCDYLIQPSYAPVWKRCATENGTCVINKTSTVRFGRDERWVSNEFDHDFVCDVATQGDDPFRGQPKVCEIMVDAGAPPLDYEYEYCAEENQTCSFDGSAVVRFVAIDAPTGAVYTIYASKRGPTPCTNDNNAFSDPYLGYVKYCEYLKYIDPNTRYDQTDLAWSSKNVDQTGNFANSQVSDPSEVLGEEQVLVEVEYSKDKDMRLYWGYVFNASITVHGEVGLKLNGYLDNSQKSFSLVGGPYVSVDSEASGSVSDLLGLTEVGIKAPIQLLDLYSPFTVTFTVRPQVLSAEISLDYFLDLIYGEVEVYYKYSFKDPITGLGVTDNDSVTIYSWNPLYQTTGNLFQGLKTWDISPVTNYIVPAVKDAFYKARIGFEATKDAREYVLEIRGTLTNNEIWDAANPNEYVTVDIVCADEIIQSTEFTGNIDEVIPLLECAEVDISGIRAAAWDKGSQLTFGVREK